MLLVNKNSEMVFRQFEDDDEKPLLEIVRSGNDFIMSQDSEMFKRVGNLWYPLRFNKKKPLEKGDYIKIGRIILCVKKICNIPVGDLEINEEPWTVDDTCKICLGNHDSKTNPLISACSCAGSLQYTHFKCLQIWVQSKLNSSARVVSFCKNDLICELCKKEYQKSYFVNGKKTSLVPRNSGPQLVLEEKHDEKRIFVISLDEKSAIKIGRNQGLDIPLRDISISRIHARIKLENSKYFLEDMNSKYGTSMLLQNSLVLPKNLCVQVAGTLVFFQKKTLFKCFCLKKRRKRKKIPNTQVYSKIVPSVDQSDKIYTVQD